MKSRTTPEGYSARDAFLRVITAVLEFEMRVGFDQGRVVFVW